MPLTVSTIVNTFRRHNGDANGHSTTTQNERELLEICSLSPEAAMARFGTHERGLDPAQVDERRHRFGPNEIARRKKLGFIGEILRRCRNPLVIQLFVIASISYFMGDVRAAAVVSVMIVLSVFLAYFQEARSSKAVEKLQAMVQTTCRVVRVGQEVELPMAEL